MEQRFEVSNPAIAKNKEWITDVAEVFASGASLFALVNAYCERNIGTEQDAIFQVIEKLRKITNNLVGIIELDGDLDIETVTEIFIRVNSAGAELSQADFAMSRLPATKDLPVTRYARPLIISAISPSRLTSTARSRRTTPPLPARNFFRRWRGCEMESDDIYDPNTPTCSASRSRRNLLHPGKLEDLVALLSGRNFETKQFENRRISFAGLKSGVLNFCINETHFKRFVMIIRSAGFRGLVTHRLAKRIEFCLYSLSNAPLPGQTTGEIESAVRKWFVMSMLTGRYSGSPESTIDYDVKQMHAQGIDSFAKTTFAGGA